MIFDIGLTPKPRRVNGERRGPVNHLKDAVIPGDVEARVVKGIVNS